MQTFLENNTVVCRFKNVLFCWLFYDFGTMWGHNMMSELELEFQKQRLKHSFFPVFYTVS